MVAKRRGGQPGRSGKHGNHSHEPKAGAGRKPTTLAGLEASIKQVLVMFGPGDVGDVRFDLSIQHCAMCGCWGWEEGRATLWGEEFGAVEGVIPVATVKVEPQTMRHKKNCPNSAHRGA